MKKITTILLSVILVMAFLCGCKKEEGTMSNEYTVTIDNNNDVYAEVPLTYTEGFASDIAVIGENDFNTEGSEALHSESALLIDASTGKVLFMKNPHKKQYPASTTKVLTSLIALKYGDKSSVRKVGDEVIINESNVILCDYRMGDLIPMDIALHGSLMMSGNDAAAVLALFAAPTLSEAADLMNKEATSLGATNSNFVNPHGLYDENHYTTAYDLYLIFNEAIKYPEFINTIACKKYTNNFVRKTTYKEYTIGCTYSNTNQYVTGVLPTPPGIHVVGGKAGYTELARRSYVMLANANGHQYIIITMRSDSVDEMYADLTYLLNKIPNNDKNYADNE
jgi:D-alanyl-D-alanine carboxypeptidase